METRRAARRGLIRQGDPVAETRRTWSGNPYEAMAAAVVQVRGPRGTTGGAGFLITADLVLTCAHVVSDALERPREEPVAEGTAVTVEFALSEPPIDGGGRPEWPALVEHWVPIRAPERTGDLAVLRLPEPVAGVRPLPMADPGRVRGGDVLAVGFPRHAPGGTWFAGRLSGPTGEGWLELSRADGQAVYVTPGFSGAPVWHDGLNAVIGLLVAAQPVGDVQRAYAMHTRTIVREIPVLGPVLRPPSPFRGLEPYEESDAGVFFGREEDVEAVVTALSAARTVTVYGPSGCGKSSLARAGVVPRIRADGDEAFVFNAGGISSVRFALATSLYEAVRSGRYGPARVDSASVIDEWLTGRGLADTLHGIRGGAPGGTVVVLDQAEALLNRTLAELDELTALLFPPGGPIDGVRVLVMLRSDLVDAVLRHPRLGPALLGGTTMPLAPMSAGQLEEVIIRPVERLPAVAYEQGLVRRILDDAGGEPGVLPLLNFVLRQLWDQQDGGYLRYAAYERMRGVSGALEGHAERAWRDVIAGDPDKEEAARRLLTKLVRMSPGSQILLRRRLTRGEVDDRQWELAQAFAGRRLLVLRGGEGEGESAELAHESLITAWPALREQVETDRKFLAGQAELAHELRRWQHGGRSPARLPAAESLLAGHWLGEREDDLTGEQREFLAQARERSRTLRRRRRTGRAVLALVAATIVVLATSLVNQLGVSAKQADDNKSQMLAGFTKEMVEDDPGLAALAAVAAYDLSPTQEARNALLQRYDQFKAAAWTLTGFQGPILNATMSTDATVTLASTERGRAVLSVRQVGGRVLRKHLAVPGNPTFPLVSRDGRRVAYVPDGSDEMIWHDVRHTASDIIVGPAHPLPGAALREFTLGGRSGSYNIVAFSPSAERIATVTSDGRLRVWDLATQRLQGLPGRFPGLLQVWFGADESTLVGAPKDEARPLVSLDLRTGAVRELEDRRDVPADGALEAEVSADGNVLVACRKPSEGGTAVYRAIRVSDGRELTRYTPPGSLNWCRHPAVDRTGENIALHEGAGKWTLLDTRRGTPPRRLLGPDLPAYTGKLGPLLDAAAHPVVVHRAEAGVTGWRLVTDSGLGSFSPPVLIDRGRAMLVRIGKDSGEAADRLVVMETEGEGRTLAETPIPPAPSDPDLILAVNHAQTLAADVAEVDDHNRITVYGLPGLRAVTQVTTRPPPLLKDGSRDRVRFFFLRNERGDDDLVTVSGTVIEHWSARDGRRLSDPLDLRDLFPGLGEFYVQRHGRPGYVQVTDVARHTLRAVGLAERAEDPALRVSLGTPIVTAAVERGGRYAMVLTPGGMIELWSVRDRERTRRILGPLGPLSAGGSRLGILEEDDSGNPGFFLAYGPSVRFMRVLDTDAVEMTTYTFAAKQEFFASTDDGRTLLRRDNQVMSLIRLDPELWKSHLCAVIGRDLSEDERRGLPAGLPDVICPL
ncbi:trypsin-like peptidase domain-containing protein [Nonomuraea wenchangensis]